jgi:hypothetical protein
MTKPRSKANEKGRSDQFDRQHRMLIQLQEERVEKQKKLVIVAYDVLVITDQSRTIAYWHLGDALLKLRKNEQLKHGEWMVFVKEHKLNYLRVKKAMRIRRKNETLESCQHLSVEEALAYDEVASLNQECDEDEEALQPGKNKAHEAQRKQASGKHAGDDQSENENVTEVTVEEMGHFLAFVQAVGSLTRAQVVFAEGVRQWEQVGDPNEMHGG